MTFSVVCCVLFWGWVGMLQARWYLHSLPGFPSPAWRDAGSPGLLLKTTSGVGAPSPPPR